MSHQTLSPKRKAIDKECRSKRRKTSEPPCQSEPSCQLTLAIDTEWGSKRRKTSEPPCQSEPPCLAVPEPSSMIKLKNEYVEPEHEELVRLTLSTGSSYPSLLERLPAPPLTEPPLHPSLLQLMPPSSSSTRSLQPPLELLSSLSLSQLLSQFPSPPGFPALPSSQPSTQNGILTVQPPALTALHQPLFLPSYSSQYIKPPSGLVFQPELWQKSPRSERKQMPPAEQKQEPPAEQKQEPPAEQKQEPPEEQRQEQPAEQKQERTEEQKQKPLSEPKQEPPAEGQARCRRSRNYKKPGWTATIDPPYPWARSRRAKVLTMEELLSKNITKIRGELSCKECKKQFEIEYDLRSKFSEVGSFITENLDDMNDRAPPQWLSPEDLDCEYCNKTRCVQPLLPERKRETNWLFLFLGQMIGHCNLTHLKYFCKHTKCHKTGAKNRLVYSAYKTLHSQLLKADDDDELSEED